MVDRRADRCAANTATTCPHTISSTCTHQTTPAGATPFVVAYSPIPAGFHLCANGSTITPSVYWPAISRYAK